MRIYLIGFMGSGKSYWGRELSRKLNIPFFDLDDKIAEDKGKPISQIFAENGEEYFRNTEREVLYMITESHPTFVMACGGGTPCFFNNIDYMKRKGVVAWVKCSTDTLYNRLVKEKAVRPLISSIPDNELRSFIVKKYSGRKIYYQQANVHAPGEDLTTEKFVDLIFHS